MMYIPIARKEKASLLGYPNHFHRILLLPKKDESISFLYRQEDLSKKVVIRAYGTEAVHNFLIKKKVTRGCCAKFAAGLNIIISHSSKSMSDQAVLFPK
jgi:hypothetical protein